MASTNHVAAVSGAAGWRQAGLRYYAYSHFLRQRFGGRVHKISLDGGFTCPNVDGTVALGGCTFCDNRSFSPSRRLPRQSVLDQWAEGVRRVGTRYRAERFLAYFQPATNTYAPVARLRALWEPLLTAPQAVGLAIGTRPDCVPDDVLDLLEELAGRTYVSVEYGMQTMHDRSLAAMNRGHGHQATIDAVERSRGRGFEICLHLILGLPEETPADWEATAREVARLRPHAVKLHNLYAVRRTPLGEQYERGEVRLLERAEYVTAVVDFIERLPPDCVVERVAGDAPPDFLLGPDWCRDKQGLHRAVDAEFARRDGRQGRQFVEPVVADRGS